MVDACECLGEEQSFDYRLDAEMVCGDAFRRSPRGLPVLNLGTGSDVVDAPLSNSANENDLIGESSGDDVGMGSSERHESDGMRPGCFKVVTNWCHLGSRRPASGQISR